MDIKDFINKYIQDNDYLIYFHFNNAKIEFPSCVLKNYIKHFSGTLHSLYIGNDQKLHIVVNGKFMYEEK